MDWFRWGKQSSIFGVSVGLAILIASFYNIYSVTLVSAIFSNSVLNVSQLGHVLSQSYDTTRILQITHVILSILWGSCSLLCMIFCRKNVYGAYIQFALACLFYLSFSLQCIWALYLKLCGSLLEESAAFRLNYYYSQAISWPFSFWLFFVVKIIAGIMIAVVALDMHWSFIKILQHGGTGWEHKSYQEFHTSQKDTVEALREKWDHQLGITSDFQDNEADQSIFFNKDKEHYKPTDRTPLLLCSNNNV